MSLPFLQAKKIGSVVMAKHKPNGGIEPMHEEGSHEPGLIAAAEALISAINMKDANAVAQALKDADTILDSAMSEMEQE